MNQRENSIYERFLDQARRHPDQTALISDQQTLTFLEMAAKAAGLSSQLPDQKIRIGVIMDHSCLQILTLFAILKSGSACIPIEPSFPDGRIRTMLDDAGADLILTDQDPERFTGCSIPVWFMKDLPADCKPVDENEIFSCKEKADDPAYLLYTSGTTGKPKGIVVTSSNVCHYVRGFEHEFHVQPDDIMLQYSVCTFDIFVEEVFCSLLNGAALAIAPAETKSDIHLLMDFVKDHQITMISGFPYLLEEMNTLPALPSSLRLLISGGDVLRQSYVSRLREMVPVYNTYGPSETTVCVSYCNCSKENALEDGTFPIGHPILNTEIVLLDENGHPVPEGEPGEICIISDGVSLGYTGDHEEENRAFEILNDSRRLYHSGDLGLVLSDGKLAFLHRKDDQVMIIGKRVEPAEVENVLSSVPGVTHAAVRAHFDSRQMAYLTGYIVTDSPDLTVKTIREHLSQYLPEYMIPEFFVKMISLPLTDHGKVDTARLPVVMKDREGY